jgi:multiple sugar transport system permease protein
MKIKKLLLGSRDKNGLLFNVAIYVMLISLGFVYLYPILHILVTSVKSLPDLLDAAVQWVPTRISFDNYKQAIDVMNVREHLLDTFVVAFLPALSQTVSCAVIGYGFARYNFPGKRILLALVLLTFVIPSYVLMVPTYTMYSDYKILGTLGTLVFPAVLGQGMKSAIFVLIFMQFFSTTPVSLDEAARVDGAGEARIFIRIAVPLSVPAVVVSFLFSFVWYWNETYYTSMYVGGQSLGRTNAISTLLLELAKFEESYRGYLQSLSNSWSAGYASTSVANEAIQMAATMVAMLPLIVIYLILQKQFVESIDRTGITGE